jgi:hypothetical protein
MGPNVNGYGSGHFDYANGVNEAAYDSVNPPVQNFNNNQYPNQANFTSQRPHQLGNSARGNFAARFKRDNSAAQKKVEDRTKEHNEAEAHLGKISVDLDSKKESLQSAQDDSQKEALNKEITDLEKQKESAVQNLYLKKGRLAEAKDQLSQTETDLKFCESAASSELDNAHKRPVAATVATDLRSLADEYEKFADNPLINKEQKAGLREDANKMRQRAKDLDAGKFNENEIDLLSSQTTQLKDSFTKNKFTLQQNKVSALNNFLEHLNVIFNEIQKVQTAQMARADNILDRLTMIR